MKRDLGLYLDDIIESIEHIENYIEDMNLQGFSDDQRSQDAIIRRLGTIGEATTKLPIEVRNKYPEIPWNEIVGMRNLIIHEYFAIKLERIWDTIIRDLPKLKKVAKKILEGL